jgi:Na+/proline symporter
MKNVTFDEAVENMRLYFGWLDFSVFGMMLGFSALIGVYFGFFDKKQESRVDYLFGGKTMKTLPVAVSLVARYVLTVA